MEYSVLCTDGTMVVGHNVVFSTEATWVMDCMDSQLLCLGIISEKYLVISLISIKYLLRLLESCAH